jgi:predicted O-methyltransferase YrrM
MVGSYYFTRDWFSRNVSIWREKLSTLANISDANILEIGSFEGRSAVWLADHILVGTGAKIHCVDLWSEPATEARFDENVRKSSLYSGCSFVKIKGPSRDILRDLGDRRFDFIYIDGEHYAPTIMIELVFSIQHISDQGIVAVDDYDLPSGLSLQHYTLGGNAQAKDYPPSQAIDAFLELFQNEIEVLFSGHQLIFKKIK